MKCVKNVLYDVIYIILCIFSSVRFKGQQTGKIIMKLYKKNSNYLKFSMDNKVIVLIRSLFHTHITVRCKLNNQTKNHHFDSKDE